jgi:alkylhydroperoxidase family enzyme
VAWIRTVADGEAEGSLKRLYDAAVQRAGRIYRIVAAMSLAQRTLAASMELYREVMFGPSELTRAQREMLAVVTSRANDCHY